MTLAELFDGLADPLVERLCEELGAELYRSATAFDALHTEISWQHMLEVCILQLTAVNSPSVEALRDEMQIFSTDFENFARLPEELLQDMINAPTKV